MHVGGFTVHGLQQLQVRSFGMRQRIKLDARAVERRRDDATDGAGVNRAVTIEPFVLGGDDCSRDLRCARDEHGVAGITAAARVLICWHVEKNAAIVHSQLISCAASEVAAMDRVDATSCPMAGLAPYPAPLLDDTQDRRGRFGLFCPQAVARRASSLALVRVRRPPNVREPVG